MSFQFVQIKTTKYEDTENFCFRSDRKWHRLQQLALWVLRKLGCFCLRDRYAKVTIGPRSILDSIVLQRAELSAVYNKEAKHLLVGSEEYPELRRELAIYCPFSTCAFEGYKQVMGLTLHIVPWITGHLVIPDLEAPISITDI